MLLFPVKFSKNRLCLISKGFQSVSQNKNGLSLNKAIFLSINLFLSKQVYAFIFEIYRYGFEIIWVRPLEY